MLGNKKEAAGPSRLSRAFGEEATQQAWYAAPKSFRHIGGSILLANSAGTGSSSPQIYRDALIVSGRIAPYRCMYAKRQPSRPPPAALADCVARLGDDAICYSFIVAALRGRATAAAGIVGGPYPAGASRTLPRCSRPHLPSLWKPKGRRRPPRRWFPDARSVRRSEARRRRKTSYWGRPLGPKLPLL